MEPEQLITLSLEEYKSLREEVVNSMERQYSLANWGISSTALLIAALAGGWVSLRGYPYLLAASVLVALPATATAYFGAWVHVISGITRLGSRLHEIEDNISKSVAVDSIRRTYKLDADTPVDPFKYLLGWEHRLWKAGMNSGVRLTARIINMVLALLYVACVGTGTLALATLGHVQVRPLVAVGVAALIFWGLAWGLVAWYLGSSLGLSVRLGTEGTRQ